MSTNVHPPNTTPAASSEQRRGSEVTNTPPWRYVAAIVAGALVLAGAVTLVSSGQTTQSPMCAGDRYARASSYSACASE
jgi:hypothetical protein